MNRVVQEYTFPTGQQLQIVEGDLTQETVDAIVNAANAQLQHGGGVAGAISRRGGPVIQAESNAWVREHGPVQPGRPAYTRGGGLPCRYVIHVVGPVWMEDNQGEAADAQLAAALRGALELAERLGLSSIAFPAISTGIFGFPKARAAGVILGTLQDYFDRQPASTLKQVRLTLFDRPTRDAFLQVWRLKRLDE